MRGLPDIEFITANNCRVLSRLGVLTFLVCLLSHSYPEDVMAVTRPATQTPYVIKNKRYYPIPSAHGYEAQGKASWYGPNFHGRRTSNGEIYDMHGMTAAHKTLPMNTVVMVKNLDNGRKTVVRINDRGPFVRGRIIDLSYTAAKKIGLVNHGTANVQVVALAEKRKKDGLDSDLVYADLETGEFYVQIGAFAQKINALKLQERFTEAGHTTVIQKYFGPDSILYRVQVYAGKNIHLAERAEKALLESGYVGAFIIAR
ncbi:septal ring lytic transglycosylase RlpA family protein [Desulforhopalus sp. IMCC35007]|uniref:septal ring lytic transglycosylase RlpA family protein n=1 Tax=Desulforhopalus sp. IMCC35007 TaxID=2569543 RepID=UPI0010AE65FD|nr:septal ring lytic transglycosylase RlpA family protein [Desulforhopalus sp. IMCC35007]TKB10231.1 septal ring lytic transglycosylase RlpA family protein [Desulforhopalus sp. IMCC35007]